MPWSRCAIAQNLAHGEGLVWNARGERVEGFSNPLWTVVMALFHLFPVPANWVSLALQIFGGLFFIASLYITKKIAEAINPGPLVPPFSSLPDSLLRTVEHLVPAGDGSECAPADHGRGGVDGDTRAEDRTVFAGVVRGPGGGDARADGYGRSLLGRS